MRPPPFDPPQGSVSGVFIDHLRFAFREAFEPVEKLLLELVAEHWADVDSPFDPDEVELVRSDKAGNFAESRVWHCRGLVLFRCMPAGSSTRGVGHVILDGSSCRLVSPSFWGVIAGVGERRAWSVRRLDGAADDDSGLLSVDALAEAYDLGMLDHLSGGARRTFDPRDPRRGTARTGWTVYLGERSKSQSFVRFYAKHHEVLANQGSLAAALIPVERVRCEVEWKPVKRGPALPWGMVADPAPYLAADCVILNQRAKGVEPVRVGRVVRDRKETELWTLLAHCSISFGAAIEQAFWVLGGDDEAARLLVDRLRRSGSKPPVLGVVEAVGGGMPDRDYIFPGGGAS